jgi:hypothetical protein
MATNETTRRIAKVQAFELTDYDRLVDEHGEWIGTIMGAPDVAPSKVTFSLIIGGGQSIVRTVRPSSWVRIEIAR